MEQIPCPDGYLLDARSPLANGHHALNQYLMRVEDAGWQQALKEINATRDKQLKLLIWKALTERAIWLHTNNPNSACVSPLRGLAERIEKWTLSLSEADLIDLLRRTADAAGFIAPQTPVPHLMEYVTKNGLTPQLAAAIREFRERVWENSFVANQTSLQLFRSRLDMLAWRDEWNEVDLKRCWSEQVRADYRAMQGSERENWRRVLYSIDGDEGTRPSPRWSAAAESMIAAIGADAFRARLLGWFEPLRPGAVQKLSREGSHILRGLIWLSEISKDPELLAAVSGIGQVVFKPKSNGEKVLRAAAQAAGLPDPTARPAARIPDMNALIAKALSVAIPPALANRIFVGPEIVNIRGDLDQYELHLSNGNIFRASDGKQLLIPSKPDVPFSDFIGVTSMLHHILLLAEDSKHRDALQ